MNYKFDSIVPRSEANALKEMIFQRVRERSESITDDVQTDVMNIARESFVSNNNPFSQIINSKPEKIEPKNEPAVDKVEISNKTTNTQEKVPAGIGFAQKELNPAAITHEHDLREEITASTYKTTMSEARESLSNKKSFLGALDFLNSQAAVSLLRTRADRFEAIG